MANEILGVLFLILVIAVIWTVLKLAFKLTAKVFSCGCLGIVALAVILILLANIQIN